MRGRQIRTPKQIAQDNQRKQQPPLPPQQYQQQYQQQQNAFTKDRTIQQRRQEQMQRVSSQPMIKQQPPSQPPLSRTVSQMMPKITEEGEEYFAKKRQIRNSMAIIPPQQPFHPPSYQPPSEQGIKIFGRKEEVEQQKRDKRQQQKMQQNNTQFKSKSEYDNISISEMESNNIYNKPNKVEMDDFDKIPDDTHVTWVTTDSVLIKEGKIMYSKTNAKTGKTFWMISVNKGRRKLVVYWEDVDVLYLDEPLHDVIAQSSAITEKKIKANISKLQKTLLAVSKKINKI